MKPQISIHFIVLSFFITCFFNGAIAQQNGNKKFLPKLCFENTEIDLGRFPNTLNPKIVFKFENCSKKLVQITSCVPSCGCTMAQCPPKPILPSSKDSIIVVYNSEDKYGFFQKSIEVKNNTSDSVIVLKIRGEVTRGLDYVPLRNNSNKF
jgi:hypothetical protein